MKIKLRKPAEKLTPNLELESVLRLVKTARQVDILKVLLQRYGSVNVSSLLPHQIEDFTKELQDILTGKLPHPENSRLP